MGNNIPFQEFKIEYRKEILKNEPVLEHWHDFVEIGMFEKADTKIFLNDKQCTLKNGDIVIINSNEIHKMFYKDDCEYERYLIYLDMRVFRPIFKALDLDYLSSNLFDDQKRVRSTNIKERTKIFSYIKEIFENYLHTNNQSELSIDVIKLLISISKLPISNVSADGKGNQLIQKIIDYINNNYMRQITLDQLENVVHLNKYHISHIFSKITGFTLIEYLQQKRILEAQKLLITTDKSITDIYFDCGFNNIQNFCRVFKRIVKMTPAKYRKLNDTRSFIC